MVLLFQVPEFALTITFRIPLPHDSNLYLVEGYILTGIHIPFIIISYFTFLWTCIRLSYVLSVVVILCMRRSYRLFTSLLTAYNSRYEYCFLTNDITSYTAI